jgi:fatty acid desaturase
MSNAITATGEKPLTPAMLRELSVRSDLQGLVRAVSHYGVIVVLGTLIWLVSSHYGIVSALPLIVAQSYFVAFLFMVVHETAHKTAFRSRELNLVFGHISSFAVFLPYEYYCLFHWDHHRYTQDPARDPELLSVPIPRSDTGLAFSYTGLRQVAFRVALLLRHALTGNATSPWIPESTRTTYIAMFVKWFAWNMPYHVEHHAYPSVPFHALPKLNQIVADQIVYRGPGYLAVTRETWAWFRRARNGA